MGSKLGTPEVMIARAKILTVINLYWNQHMTSGTDIELEFGIGLIILGHHKQHGPLTFSKDSLEGHFVNSTGLR